MDNRQSAEGLSQTASQHRPGARSSIVKPRGTSNTPSLRLHVLVWSTGLLTIFPRRTHRERKENYIKALELELARLREIFVIDQNNATETIAQHKAIIENQQRENLALREILTSRGIPYENELENRKAVISMRTKMEDASLTPPSIATLSPPSVGGRSAGYRGNAAAPASTTTGYSPQAYLNGGHSASGHSPGTTHYSHSPQGPDIQEFSIKQESNAVADMPGIFEKEPQLGIDFILK